MTPALLQALIERRPCAAVLTVELPASAGGPLRLSDRSLVSETLGPIPDLVKSWGKLVFKLSDRDGNLETPSFDVAVADGTQARRVGILGRLGRRLEDVPATVHWAAQGVHPDQWSLRFTGRLVSRRPSGRGEYALKVAIDDRWLNRTIGPRLTVDLWPSAATLGLRAPIAYGSCDSTGLGSHGLRRLLYVDTVGPWRWLYSLGDVAVDHVFVDGEERPDTAWMRVVERRGGWLWTTIDFAAWPGKDPADKTQIPVVTADADGLDVGSFGSSSSAAAQARHVLEAFGRGRWDAESPLTAQLTDDDAWDALEAWSADQGCEAGGILGGRSDSPTLRSFLSDVLRTWSWAAHWTRSGRLAVHPERYVRVLPPPDPGVTPWLVEGENVIDPASFQDEEPDQRGPGFRVRYCSGPDGDPLLAVTALYPDRLESDPEEVSAPLGPQRVVDPPLDLED